MNGTNRNVALLAACQDLNDILIFVTLSGASLAAGYLLELLSWNTVALVTLPMTVLIGSSTLWLMAKRRREAHLNL